MGQISGTMQKGGGDRSPSRRQFAGRISGNKTNHFGNVLVQVVQGDLIQQQTDAIVNPIGFDMNMVNAGEVSKAVAKAAGPAVQDDCSKLGPQAAGSVVVTGPGNLLHVQNIIHVIPGRSLQTSIKKCLQVADDYGFKSVSLPAIETGMMGMSCADSAQTIFQALANVCPNLQNLKVVRIVIFHAYMVETFQQTFQQYLTGTFKQNKPDGICEKNQWEEIQERVKKEKENEQAEVLYKTVKWQYELLGTRRYFNKSANAVIEKAHANYDTRVTVEVQEENYVIVFAKSTGIGMSTGKTMSVTRTTVGSTGSHGGEDTIPTEIFARGPEALKAYKEALQSGKTKNRRLLVMVVGPARVGKTSLLKSLNGEKFDPSEDSTDGIQLQHTFCKPQENCWSKDSDEGISYTDCMADIIHENLRGETDENIAEATKEPIEKSVESSESLQKNDADDDDLDDDDDDDNDNDDDEDDNNKASKAESLNEETNKMENQENISWESTSNLPKAIEEKLLMKLKDIESDKTKVNELYVKTLDFAGQAVYNVTHPIFLTSKAVFILVYNLKNILHDPMKSKVENHGSERELVDPIEMTNLENLELWLSCISSYTDGERRAKVDELSLPPVFIVGTHADKFDGNLEAAKQIIREIYKCLSPSKNPSGFHVKRDEVYTVNNRISGNGEIRDESVRKLKSDIEELSKSLPHVKEDIPLHWLLFEEELSSLVEKESKKYITIDEAMKIANKCKVNTSAESKEFTTLLNYLHDLKTIIYFEEIKIVFIDTQWLVKVFTKVIEVRVAEKRGGFDKFWDKLEEEGILERALVEHVWKGLVDEQNTIDSLLLIMEKFSLICRWNTSEEEEVYLVPCMLCNSKKRDDIAMFFRHQKTSTMVIRFNTSHVSLGIFPRLFVAIAEEGKKEWPNLRQPKLCKNFCRIFNVGKETNLDICIIQSSIRTISVAVCNKQNIDGQRVTEFCQHFRKLLDQIFERMRHNFPWMQSMKFEYGILCSVCASSPNKCKSHGMEGCTRDSCLHFVNEEELILDRPECCEDVAHLDNVIKEEAYSYWFPKTVVGSTLTFNLTENQKRWLVIGICLNIVLLPPVRKFLEPNILNHYTNLKASNHIDNQVYGGHLVNDGKCRALNYRSINNNITISGVRNYDYNVTSVVDLAKLYLQPHMAKFTEFDNTCDLSAVLRILSTASVFSSDVQNFSSKVREEVRNEWGHCNVQSWDETHFADCFKLMHSLLKALKLSSDDEKKIADQLTDWENKGVVICMANKVQPELVKDIEDKVTQLSREFQLALSRNKENIGQLSEDVEHLALHQKELCTVLDTLQTVQDAVQSLKQRMGLVEERLGKVEDKVEKVDVKVGKVEDEVGRVDEKCDRLYDQFKVLEARELKKC